MSIRPLDLQVNVNSSIEVSKKQGELQARQANLQVDQDEKAASENAKNQQKVNESDKASELLADDNTINNKEKKRDQSRKSKKSKSDITAQDAQATKKRGNANSNHKIDFTA
jgi:hypothetical protein